MADVKVSDLPALGVLDLTGLEAFIVQNGNTNSKVLLDVLGAYLAGSIVGYSNVTLNGGANNGLINNYVDLFTPAVGKMFEAVLLKSTGLLPSDASISVVLHDGTPANDVEIMPAVSTAELDGVLFKYGANGETVSGGYSLKLLITGNTVTAGTVLVVANYLI
jgi:hypothetical protein